MLPETADGRHAVLGRMHWETRRWETPSQVIRECKPSSVIYSPSGAKLEGDS